MLKSFLLVGLGGALGSMARYGVTKMLAGIQVSFPIATFVVNIFGCFILGLFLGFLEKNQLVNSHLMLFLAVGFCGGFTTFAAFAYENLILFEKQLFTINFLYIILSIAVGMIFFKAGLALVNLF